MQIEKGSMLRKPISKTRPTYINFPVEIEHHRAAVQISIVPFNIRSIPGQTFFNCGYRYALCCDLANPGIICQRVQAIYDAQYHPTQWDFSNLDCCTIDSARNDLPTDGDCSAFVVSKLKEYVEWVSTIAEEYHADTVGDSDIEGGAVRLSSKRPAEIGHAQSGQRKKILRRCDAEGGGTEEERHMNTDRSGGDDDSDDTLVREAENGGNAGRSDKALQKYGSVIAQKIRSGLEVIAKEGRRAENAIEWPTQGQTTVDQLSIDIEERLCVQAKTSKTSGREVSWMLRYLACCFALRRVRAGSSEPYAGLAESGRLSAAAKRRIDRWRSAARMTNLIIDGLFKTWGWRAFSVASALAAKNYGFSKVAQLSKETQQGIVAFVLLELPGKSPDLTVKVETLFPPSIISKTLALGYTDVCAALDMYSVESQADPIHMASVISEKERIVGIWWNFDTVTAVSTLSNSQFNERRSNGQKAGSDASASMLSAVNWSRDKGTQSSDPDRLYGLIATAVPAVALTNHQSQGSTTLAVNPTGSSITDGIDHVDQGTVSNDQWDYLSNILDAGSVSNGRSSMNTTGQTYIPQDQSSHRRRNQEHSRMEEEPSAEPCLFLEEFFNQSTYAHYMVSYDSPIFTFVQSGDIVGTRELLQLGKASIYDIDPYSLGLLYYASYYCWRCNGAKSAIDMCRMLVGMGADMSIVDEIGNGPMQTMVDSALADGCSAPNSSALADVANFYQMTSYELVEQHRCTSGLTPLHMTLLGINPEIISLEGHLQSLQRLGSLPDIIDKPDLRGRSALAWAVEYGLADAAQTLLSYGANAGQYRGTMPLLHLAIAGPPPNQRSGLFRVVQLLLAAGIHINVTDEEGWSAWHVAASWRSYDILREILAKYGNSVDTGALTTNGESAGELSHDEGFQNNFTTVTLL